MNLALKRAKFLIQNDFKCVTTPHYLFSDKCSQTYKSIAGERTTFINFHEYMFSQINDDLNLLHKGYKLEYINNRKEYRLFSILCWYGSYAG